MDREEVGSRLVEAGLPATALLSYLDGNPSFNLPYHNNDHCYNVAADAYDLGKEYRELTLDDLRHLLVAGLFHDYAHTGYSHPDSMNITAAVHFIQTVERGLTGMGLEPEEVIRLIRATENPAPPGVGYRLDEKVMRDADLLGWCRESNREKFLHGLSIELEEPVTQDSTRKFLSSTKFHTRKAYEKFREAGWVD